MKKDLSVKSRKGSDSPAKERGMMQRETREVKICSPAFLKYYNKLKEKPFFMSEGDAKSYGLDLSKVEFK